MTDRELMQQALEALERCVATCFDAYAHEQVMSRPEHFVNQNITALRERLAEQDINQMEAEFKHNIRKTQDRIRDKVRPGVYEVTGPLHVVCQCDKCKAQPEQEPMKHGGRPMTLRECMEAEEPTQPAQQQPLTEKRIEELYSFWIVDCQDIVGFARAIERSKPQMQPCAGRNCGSTNPNLHSAECFEDYEKSTGMAQSVAPKCGAIIEVFGKDWRLDYMSLPVGKHKLYTQQYNYTAPQRREWVGLTEEERMDVLLALNWDKQLTHMDTAKSIEAKLKEKNA